MSACAQWSIPGGYLLFPYIRVAKSTSHYMWVASMASSHFPHETYEFPPKITMKKSLYASHAIKSQANTHLISKNK